MQETWIQSLYQEDPLAKGMTIHSSILAWRIPQTDKPGRATAYGVKDSDITKQLTYTHTNMDMIINKIGLEVVCVDLSGSHQYQLNQGMVWNILFSKFSLKF